MFDFGVDPAVYPYFEIYAGECCDGRLSEPVHNYITLPATYPRFAICESGPLHSALCMRCTHFHCFSDPAVYPYFEIYAGEVCDGSLLRQDDVHVTLPAMYPRFAICAFSRSTRR